MGVQVGGVLHRKDLKLTQHLCGSIRAQFFHIPSHLSDHELEDFFGYLSEIAEDLGETELWQTYD